MSSLAQKLAKQLRSVCIGCEFDYEAESKDQAIVIKAANLLEEQDKELERLNAYCTKLQDDIDDLIAHRS